MNQTFPVDLDQEAVLFDNKWLDRKSLAERIRQMIDAQDFRIGSAGTALESLQKTISGSRLFSCKLSGEDSEQLESIAHKSNLPAGALIRAAVQAYLAGQGSGPTTRTTPTPALSLSSLAGASIPTFSSITTVTTEPASEAEALQAIPLTQAKSIPPGKPNGNPKVVIDPSLVAPGIRPEEFEGTWFKKD